MKSYLLLVFLLLITPAFAFTVTTPDETIVVPIGTTRQIDISISSNTADDVTLALLDSKPWISQSTSMMKFDGPDVKTLSLYVTPFMDTQPSVYKITLQAESLKTGEEQKKGIFINVNKIETIVIDKVEINGSFTPTGQVTIIASIKNYKPRTVEDIKLSSSVNAPSSKLIEFEQNIDSIDAGETKNVTYSFTLPKQAEPGLYSFDMRATAANETSEKIRTFTVISQAKFTQDSGKQPLIFGFRKTITVTNIGNTPDDALVSEYLSPFEAAFYSGEQPVSTKSQFTWLLKDIKPGESRTIQYRIDYSPLFLFVLVVAIVAWLFFFKVRTVRMKKFILEKKFIEEGEEFTVGVEIMNSTGKKIENATIKDFVPSVFDMKEGEGPKPTKKKTAAGTELVWKIKDLHKNEERILSYKILPVFGVHGTIRLPQASASFSKGKKEAEIRSGFANIGIETESYGEKKSLFRKKKE